MTATLKRLVSFSSSNGAYPTGGLVADANGDLFGTTQQGGASGYGTVFEIVNTATGYATAPTRLVSFNSSNGASPAGSLLIDAKGDLFGTTQSGGASGQGAVFEIANTATGYATAPTVLASFSYSTGDNPSGNLVADTQGDLFGTLLNGGGLAFNGAVFEIKNTSTGYASAPTMLVGFANPNGANPNGTLIIDGKGNLFGTTQNSGTGAKGIVFEVKNTATGYATAPTTLLNFNNTNGASPQAGLVADANGDLFGVTAAGGATGNGAVFEIANTATGFATSATVLASFGGNSVNGSAPYGTLIIDANGDLFGTTSGDGGTGTYGSGTVFEIANTATGYASTPITVAALSGTTAPIPGAVSTPTQPAICWARPGTAAPVPTARCSRSAIAATSSLASRPARGSPPRTGTSRSRRFA